MNEIIVPKYDERILDDWKKRDELQNHFIARAIEPSMAGEKKSRTRFKKRYQQVIHEVPASILY